MAGLPLFQIPPALLEKIINQLEWKSYFRMQQTCHDMEELVQSNRRIVHRWQKGPFLNIGRNDDNSLKFYVVFENLTSRTADVESLYGVRFDFICLPPGLVDSLNEFCEMLKKYRITGKDADFYSLKDFNPEKYVALFKVLKPVRVELVSRGSNLLEVLLEVKELKQVAATVDLSDLARNDLFLIKEFLSQFEKIRFLVHNGEMTEFLRLFKEILQFLRYTDLPKLHSFILSGKYFNTTQLPPVEDQLDRFRDYNPVLSQLLLNSDPPGEMYQYNLKCDVGQERNCDLVIDCYCAEIHFEPVIEHESV